MCTVIYTEGYSYKNWYDVIKDTNTSSVDNKTVLLRFYVHGVSNAHIMLTPDPSLQGYEIIFGAGSNTYYDIRKFSKYAIINYWRPTINAPIGVSATAEAEYYLQLPKVVQNDLAQKSQIFLFISNN